MMRPLPVVLAVLTLGFPGLARAQGSSAAPAGVHQGFWIGFGLGGGTNFADFADGARAGVGGYLRMGGTLSQRVLIGGEISGWGRDRDGATFTESGMTATVLYFPAAQGFFVKAGAGFAGWAASSSVSSTTTTTTAAGFAGTVGVGYDLQIGGNLFLTPNLDFLYHTLSSDNAAWTNISSGSVLLFTLGLTWH